MEETLFYKKLKEKKVQCETCSHFCIIENKNIGKCGVRKNINGKLYLTTYQKIAALNIDPIEKKPFFHFLPGSKTLSLASEGCSFFCKNCQNWELSQNVKKREPKGKNITEKEVVALAEKNKTPSISYTYTDPTSFYEFALKTMKLATKKNIKNCFVTHGFMSKKALLHAAPFLNAVNVDIKSFSEKFYKENCKARLKPVLDNTVYLKKSGVWVEVTTLVIPTLSDSKRMLRSIAQFIYHKLGSETPWHISRFSASFSHNLKEIKDTPSKTLEMAYNIGIDAGLKYVYVGNINSNKYQNTYCPKCKMINIERDFYLTKRYDEDGKCLSCNYSLNICQ